MGKYMLQVSYTAEGARGLIKEGASSRIAYVTDFAADLGATVESFYFALGEHDAVLILDAADDSVAAAASLAVGASGAASVRTTKLLTGAEADAAVAQVGAYRAPGT